MNQLFSPPFVTNQDRITTSKEGRDEGKRVETVLNIKLLGLRHEFQTALPKKWKSSLSK